MSEWRPISTAPKDGTTILGYPAIGVYNELYPAPMFWREDKYPDLWIMAAAEGEYMEPTHWMPVPEPPKGGDAS